MPLFKNIPTNSSPNTSDFLIGVTSGNVDDKITIAQLAALVSANLSAGTAFATKAYNPYKFRAYRSASVSTADVTTYNVVFDNEVFDTSNNYNNATGIFTAPVSGYYQVNVHGHVAGGPGTNWLWQAVVNLLLNGSLYVLSDFYDYDQGRVTYLSLRISELIYLNAGDQLKVSASADTNSGSSWSFGGGQTTSLFEAYLVCAT